MVALGMIAWMGDANAQGSQHRVGDPTDAAHTACQVLKKVNTDLNLTACTSCETDADMVKCFDNFVTLGQAVLKKQICPVLCTQSNCDQSEKIQAGCQDILCPGSCPSVK